VKSKDNLGKPKKMQDFEVWFDDNGDLAIFSYPGYRQQGKKEQNSVFQDTLEYVGYFSATGGNSHIKMQSIVSGRTYHMFMTDFHEALFTKRFIDNRIAGLFTFVKKGSSQGIRIFFEAP
jgi:hypothetical protein